MGVACVASEVAVHVLGRSHAAQKAVAGVEGVAFEANQKVGVAAPEWARPFAMC